MSHEKEDKGDYLKSPSQEKVAAVASQSASIDEDCFYVGEKKPVEMTKLKFSANLSTMFADIPFLERFKKAKDCGFDCVEIQNPYTYQLEDLVAARGDLKIDLVNSYNGDHQMGCAAIPGLEDVFTRSMQTVLKYEFELGFKKLHIMSGMRDEKFTVEEQTATFIRNLKNLVASDFLENRNMIGLLEPLSSSTKEGYFLNSFKQAIEIIKEVNSPQIKLLLDVFHLENITKGHLSRFLPCYYEYAGHIQVSQSPGRGPPFSDGTINFDDIFNFFQRRGHSDFIGLECFSSGNEDYSYFVKGCW